MSWGAPALKGFIQWGMLLYFVRSSLLPEVPASKAVNTWTYLSFLEVVDLTHLRAEFLRKHKCVERSRLISLNSSKTATGWGSSSLCQSSPGPSHPRTAMSRGSWLAPRDFSTAKGGGRHSKRGLTRLFDRVKHCMTALFMWLVVNNFQNLYRKKAISQIKVRWLIDAFKSIISKYSFILHSFFWQRCFLHEPCVLMENSAFQSDLKRKHYADCNL